MRKIVIAFGVLLLALLPYLAKAQDTGNIDTAIVQCLEKVRPNTQVVMNVYVVNDEGLGAITIPLRFPDSISNLDITCDSISFVGTRAASAAYKSDSTSINNAKNRLVVLAIWIAGELGTGNVASGPVAKIYFTTGSSWDSTSYVPVDTVVWPPIQSLEFTNASTGVAFTPAFVKGCLGKEPIVPTIKVNSPNGGENWRVGSLHDITWSSQNFTGNVKIEYSTNAGSTWTTIISSTVDDGVHPWAIPNTPTTQGRVKVSGAATGTPSDISDANFTISTAPVITVPGMQTVLCDTLICDTLRFEVYATDGDPADILTITKYGVGDFYTVPHPTPDTGFLTWVPVPADTGTGVGIYIDTFIVDDGTGLADTGMVMIKVKPRAVVPPSGKEGDVNGDGKINVTDVIFLVNFLFKNGPEPNPPPAGDINADCVTTVSDIVYLINYLYKGGAAPKIRCNPGDIDYDGYVNIPDVIYFINYLFKSGPAPRSMKSSDVNADCNVDIVDLIYLINFLFRGGPIPQPGCVEPMYKAIPPALAEVELSEPKEVSGIIEIPINSNFDLPVAGVQILIEFDPSQFEPLDPILTERSQNLSLFFSYKDNHQIIGLLDLQGQNYIQPGAGSIATLRFKPKVANYDLSRLKISEAILVDSEANTLQTTIK